MSWMSLQFHVIPVIFRVIYGLQRTIFIIVCLWNVREWWKMLTSLSPKWHFPLLCLSDQQYKTNRESVCHHIYWRKPANPHNCETVTWESLVVFASKWHFIASGSPLFVCWVVCEQDYAKTSELWKLWMKDGPQPRIDPGNFLPQIKIKGRIRESFL